jgi:hypothetical protein
MGMIDWAQHLHTGRAVRVLFAPRVQHNGNALLPGMQAFAGEALDLTPLWLQDDDDPYPGEWALGTADHGFVLGRAWISSGDVCEPPNMEFSGVPAGHSSNHPAGGTSAATPC